MADDPLAAFRASAHTDEKQLALFEQHVQYESGPLPSARQLDEYN
jgi:hypothetical protein